MQQVEELVIVLDFHFMAVLGRTLGRFVSQFCGKRFTEVTVYDTTHLLLLICTCVHLVHEFLPVLT